MPPERAPQRKEKFDIDAIKNWEEGEGGIYLKNIEAVPTPLWRDGWYKNPSSGRSNNFGIKTENAEKHSTVVVKGGSFFFGEKAMESLRKERLSTQEFFGGVSFKDAQKEYQVADLVQKTFKTELGKKANCPQPMDTHAIAGIQSHGGEPVQLDDFFANRAREEDTTRFTLANLVAIADRLGIDPKYPNSEEADEEAKRDPYRWLVRQCLERESQGVYRYRIEGPNTRLRDLMTLEPAERQAAFVEANDAGDIRDAVEKFSARLGEFYGVLHKNNIGYHFGFSEHCTLIDTTAAGMVMDIGGLTQNHLVNPDSQAYLVQMIKTTNLIGYLCKHILKTDQAASNGALDAFWQKYKGIYSNPMIEHFSQNRNVLSSPSKIRTVYFNSLEADWMTLASDLEDLSYTDTEK